MSENNAPRASCVVDYWRRSGWADRAWFLAGAAVTVYILFWIVVKVTSLLYPKEKLDVRLFCMPWFEGCDINWIAAGAVGTVLAFAAVIWVNADQARRVRDRERRDAGPLAAVFWHELTAIERDVKSITFRTNMILSKGDPIESIAAIKAMRGRFVPVSIERFANQLGCFNDGCGDALGAVLAAAYRLDGWIASAEVAPGNGLIVTIMTRGQVKTIEHEAFRLCDAIDQVKPLLSQRFPLLANSVATRPETNSGLTPG